MPIGQEKEQMPHCTQRAESGTTQPSARARCLETSPRKRFRILIVLTAFLTLGVTIQTAISYIRDVFFIMFFDHFILVMTGVAVGLRSTRRVTLTAISICITMVHRETVIEGCPPPGGGIVTL